MSKQEIKTSKKMIKNFVKILELLGDSLEVCVSVQFTFFHLLRFPLKESFPRSVCPACGDEIDPSC